MICRLFRRARDLQNRQQITRKLLAHITKAKVPAIGFVNENKLYKNEKRDEAQIDLLRSWLDAESRTRKSHFFACEYDE